VCSVLFLGTTGCQITSSTGLTGINLPSCPGSYDKNTWTNCAGTYTYADGSKYVGGYKDGKRHGQGTYTFADGSKYVGEFKSHKYNGQGTLTIVSGEKYVGEWKDDRRHGQGTLTLADGTKYVGGYKDGKRHGQGTYTSANGEKYVGEFKDGIEHGQGTAFFTNGDKYVGEFKDGTEHGQGSYIYADGSKYVGQFKDGELTLEGTDIFADGTVQKHWLTEVFKANRASNYDRSFQILRPRAESGNAQAQAQLGLLFHGVDLKSKEAQKFRLSRCTSKWTIGLCTPWHTAYHWYSMSAEQNHPAGQYLLGMLLFESENNKSRKSRDTDRIEDALEWLLKARNNPVDTYSDEVQSLLDELVIKAKTYMKGKPWYAKFGFGIEPMAEAILEVCGRSMSRCQ